MWPQAFVESRLELFHHLKNDCWCLLNIFDLVNVHHPSAQDPSVFNSDVDMWHIDASTATRDCDMKETNWEYRHTQRKARSEALLSERQLHVHTNKPSFGNKLIPPADSPNHTHILHPIPFFWPPSETTTNNKNDKRWSCANEHKYGKLIHGRQIEGGGALDLSFVMLV